MGRKLTYILQLLSLYLLQSSCAFAIPGFASDEIGRLEVLKQKENDLKRMLAEVKLQKLSVLRDRPLKIGIVGYGRFGQFIAKTFTKYGSVVVTSRSDYKDIAQGMGVEYVHGMDYDAFLGHNLDVIVLATSITSFGDTVDKIVPHLNKYIQSEGSLAAPLIVDVLSVKEHPRNIMLEKLPKECDILCTHPMFGPDSARHGWNDLTFVFERTRIGGYVLKPEDDQTCALRANDDDAAENNNEEEICDDDIDPENLEYLHGVDRVERFLSIWEEEGCRMVRLSCHSHDSFSADSQFITHLMGRILGAQGLKRTPIDTKGFESVMKLIGTTTSDSFDLFYGLYKYNQHSMETIVQLQEAMNNVIKELKERDNIQKS